MKRSKGFTLIEVVLVLAIAGLIFMMVFITLPTVWANQRDAARRDDMLTFIQRLKDFQGNNNRGALPTMRSSVTELEEISRETAKNELPGKKDTWAAFYRDYFEDSFMDPIGENYKLMVSYCSGGNSSSYEQILGKLDERCESQYGKEINGDSNGGNPPTYPNDQKVYVLIGAKCNGEKAIGSANVRKVAVLYKLEGGGVYCGES